MFLVTSCSEGEAAPVTTAAPFSGETPEIAALSRDEIEDLKGRLEEPPPPEGEDLPEGPPSFPIPASVFDVGSAIPNVSDPDWIAAMTILSEVRDVALAGGWSILVEGFTDSSGSIEFNEVLSTDRAIETREAIIDLGYPAAVVVAEGRGVGGDEPEDRRIVITFIRES